MRHGILTVETRCRPLPFSDRYVVESQDAGCHERPLDPFGWSQRERDPRLVLQASQGEALTDADGLPVRRCIKGCRRVVARHGDGLCYRCRARQVEREARKGK